MLGCLAGKIESVAPAGASGWTFLTNHAHVLIAVAAMPDARIRDLAKIVGITERAVLRIIAELEGEGYLAHERAGRRNVYRVDGAKPFRHALEKHREVGALLELVGAGSGSASRALGGKVTP